MTMKRTIGILVIVSLLGLVAIYAVSNNGNQTETGTILNTGATATSNAGELETHDSTQVASFSLERSPDVPELPFIDNPDPAACGAPELWRGDNVAYLTGIYEGELIQPTVFLYDSHARLNIVAEAQHGTQVEIILYQRNPTLNYYMVRILDAPAGANEGWIPAPLLSFEPL